jgi:hypothetical protein
LSLSKGAKDGKPWKTGSILRVKTYGVYILKCELQRLHSRLSGRLEKNTCASNRLRPQGLNIQLAFMGLVFSSDFAKQNHAFAFKKREHAAAFPSTSLVRKK